MVTELIYETVRERGVSFASSLCLSVPVEFSASLVEHWLW
jgi:hypothetical protein